MDRSPPGSSVHEILQARILEWVAVPFFSGFSRLRDQTPVSCTADRFCTTEPPGKPFHLNCLTLLGCKTKRSSIAPYCYLVNIPHFFLGIHSFADLIPGGTSGKEPACQFRILKRCWFEPWRGERSPGGGHGNSLQYSCLENPIDRGAWWAMVYRVAKSRTRLKLLSTHT